ncbi:TetR/AcrR family transcriptional regulator [uncultured Corynebacterium sp.]|uniref:TetR/AcrR family transcriptional regulator n=1 Tax=uncultured Corynebacterium sp. TaxID=159447 RepID=UPI0025DB7315|nr:TetR/AcrR family transcriptional regulator [uncultured Corynebacterium sp.]
MTTSKNDGYHHGNLRQALVEAAVAILERGDTFSLRAVAREAGVSPTAPYRHFSDRSELESAVAAEGFQSLGDSLLAGGDLPSTSGGLTEFAVRYVRFALRRPRMFSLMFGTVCDDRDDDRVLASGRLHENLGLALARVYPGRSETEITALSTGLWSTAHGLACLHVDGKLSAADPGEVDDRVREAFSAILPPA